MITKARAELGYEPVRSRADGFAELAPPRRLRARSSSEVSSFACRAPIRAGERRGAALDDVLGALGSERRETLDQQLELVVDHRLEALHQPGDVAGAEPGRLVPARLAEPGDRLDDPHVGRRVAVVVRAQDADLGQPLQRPLGDLEPPQDILLGRPLTSRAERPGDERVARCRRAPAAARGRRPTRRAARGSRRSGMNRCS